MIHKESIKYEIFRTCTDAKGLKSLNGFWCWVLPEYQNVICFIVDELKHYEI